MQKQVPKLDSDQLLVDLVDALAEAEGVPPDEMDYTLHDYVDPDALVRLAEGCSSDWQLTFDVSGHQVKITDGNQLIVDDVTYRTSVPA